MSNESLLNFPLTLKICSLQEKEVYTVRNVNRDDTLFDVLSKIEHVRGHDGLLDASNPQHFRAYLPNEPIQNRSNAMIAGDAEEILFASPRNELVHVILEGLHPPSTLGEQPADLVCNESGKATNNASDAVSGAVSDEEGAVFSDSTEESTNTSIHSSIQYRHLPPEVLRDIFRYTVIPPVFITQKFVAAPVRYRQALKGQNSLSLVCKGWYHAAMDVIYEEVYLWSLWQLSKFLECLERSNKDRRGLVKNLVIEILTPDLGEDEDCVFLESGTSIALYSLIHYICFLCPNISNLSCFPTAVDKDDHPLHFFFEGNLCDKDCTSILPNSLFPYPSSLQELRLGQEAVHLLFGHATSALIVLEVLEISLSSSSYLFAIRTAELPNLKCFRCNLYQDNTTEDWSYSHTAPLMRAVASSFVMPRLEHLTISVSQWTHNRTIVPMKHLCKDLINSHKERLVYLCLVGFKASVIDAGLAGILEDTPRLRHLVIDNYPLCLIFNEAGVFTHKTLEYIDVWCSLTGDFIDYLEKVDANITTKNFPALKCPPRLFDGALLHSTRAFVNLPTVIPPGDMDGGVRYPGLIDIGMTRDGRIVYKNDLGYIDSRWDWNNLELLNAAGSSNESSRSVSPLSKIFRSAGGADAGESDEDDLDYQWEDVSSTDSAEDYESDSSQEPDSGQSAFRGAHFPQVFF
ncbi:hypothetical protein PQX77_021415 [Marasmius sp. AFHP31]|nr:hypothetical protein PQX77_021415 [Marasmius sp. AFHP31]